MDHEATVMMKTQFMSFWDGLLTNAKYRIMIIGATNRPGDVDAAILRRMPCMFHVDLPVRFIHCGVCLLAMTVLNMAEGQTDYLAYSN